MTLTHHFMYILVIVTSFMNQSLLTNCILDIPLTLLEVKHAVSKLQKGKAVGIDGIMNEVFKYGGEQVTCHLLSLCQRVFSGEKFPVEWARGIIYPLFKGGPDEHKLD